MNPVPSAAATVEALGATQHLEAGAPFPPRGRKASGNDLNTEEHLL
jgi:hypothetical protein